MIRALAAVLAVSLPLATVLIGAPPAAAATEQPRIVINELTNGGPGASTDAFFELRNLGNETVDLSGWNVYRCSEFGLRRNDGQPEVFLDGVTLAPGAIFTVARIGADLGAGVVADDYISAGFYAQGFGLYLETADGERADAVGVFPNSPWPMHSECTVGENLPNSLNFVRGESWQRISDTGDAGNDFVTAKATPSEQNALRDTGRPTDEGVLVSELAPAGPASDADDFVELRNYGSDPIDLGGWELYRCTATGRVTAESRQLVLPATVLRPGEEFVIGGPDFSGEADATVTTSLADETYGVALQTDDGALADEVGVSSFEDTACQPGDDKLPSTLDFGRGESWQRVGTSGDLLDDFLIAPRTPGERNATEADSLEAQELAYDEPGVVISEIATDPAPAGLPDGWQQRNFIELANYGDEPVEIGGWSVYRCEATGIRSREPQVTIADGARLAPGETFLAAREGTPLAEEADATYDTALNFLGAGVWVQDARGERVDSVGAYQANEMDVSNDVASPCTKGLSLTTYEPDRLLGETFQRARFTGSDYDDFVVAEATPGDGELLEWRDRTVPSAESLESVVLPAVARGTADSRAPRGAPAPVLASYEGVTEQAPPVERVPDGETDAQGGIADDGYGYPYQRFELDGSALAGEASLTWRGETQPRAELQAYLWRDGAWRLTATGTASVSGSVSIRFEPGDATDLLVQAGPRTESTFAGEPDGEFEDPGDYDLAITHLTDTQYLSETYPEVYAEEVAWIIANEEARKIAFATHTGDLVQNWVDPDQNDVRAIREFERASAIQGLLDDAGVPNSVLPGNHDNKRGQTDELFNEYFGPERYEETPWYGGSIAPDDNSANFSTFERAGARFLMLSLPYAYGDRELDWAEQVVADHPDHNVVVSTHEHLSPKTRFESSKRSSTSRWVSAADQLWERVIAPNRNVVLVLSGHFHGVGQIVTENAGGLEGHTVVELLADYQEFRTHTGERATGFERLLQLDLSSGQVAVDTFSQHLGSTAAHEYDYEQFIPDNGDPSLASNARPWRILEHGLQGRYTAIDDEFVAQVVFQHDKSVETESLTMTTDEMVAASGR